MAERGIRASIVTLSPSVHGEGDRAFVPMMINIAREKGFAAYIGDGTNRWPAALYRLALESAPAGSRMLGVGDVGIPFREIAEVIGRQLNVPTVSTTPEEAAAHFGFLGPIAAFDIAGESGNTGASGLETDAARTDRRSRRRALFCIKKGGCTNSLKWLLGTPPYNYFDFS
ncbi:hypothetical protein [Paenibacillus sp. BJ-4]|uniref:hypothetical protein n=1 Tax=Paenibacillus sp. BJ-4 TaxID=2878097 RepID=UPI001CF009B6|nr:hypothetical protein [Paenibacillus sp. BJ-4]